MNQKFKTDINKYFSKTLKTNEQFKNHTTIGVGGPADYYLAIMSKLDLLKAYKLASDYKIPIFIFGTNPANLNQVFCDQQKDI